MERTSFYSAVVIVLVASSALCAEPQGVVKATAAATAPAGAQDDNDRPVVRKWDIKFETAQEPARLAINGDCSSFFEKRFVAEFDVEIPTSPYSTSYPLRDGYGYPTGTAIRSPQCLASQALKGAIAAVPGLRRPPRELFDAATSSSVLRNSSRAGDAQHCPFTYQVFAPSAERARELAQTIISIYGEAFSVPSQESLKTAVKSGRDHLALSRQKVAKLEAELASVNKELDGLKDYDGIKAESLVAFTERLRALRVDMAETKGCLDASEKLLARSAPNSPTNNQAAASKARAEIQLAGQEAKRSEIEKILKDGALRLDLVGKQGRLRYEIDEETISFQETCIADSVKARQDAEACPVPDSKVIIRAIKWEPPKAEPQRAAFPAQSGYPTVYR